MDDIQYIEQRLDKQIDWYSARSHKNQNWHKRLQIIQILCAACIPFLPTIIQTQATLNIVAGGLGVFIGLTTGITALYKFEEKWIKYRTTAESLKHEKIFYDTRVEPYNGENPFPNLVKRVEALISQENRDWTQYSTLNQKKGT